MLHTTILQHKVALLGYFLPLIFTIPFFYLCGEDDELEMHAMHLSVIQTTILESSIEIIT